MTNSQRLVAVRDALRGWILGQQPENSQAADPLGEAMLIQDGYFCGRRFRFPGHTAIWFLEEDEVKLRDTQGQVVARLQGDEINRWAEAWRAAKADRESPATLSMTGSPATCVGMDGGTAPSESTPTAVNAVETQRRAA